MDELHLRPDTLKMIILLHGLALSLTLAGAATPDTNCVPDLTARVTADDHFDRERVGIVPESRLRDTRPIYDASFEVTSRDDSAMFIAAREHLLTWMSNMKKTMAEPVRRQVAAVLHAPRPPITVIRADPRILRLVVLEPSADAGRRTLVIFAERADRSDGDLMWRHEIALAENGTAVRVNARVISWRPSGKPPRGDTPNMPRVIRDIMEHPGGRAWSGRSHLVFEPFILTDDNGPSFSALLNDPDRQVPLIYVSRPGAGSDSSFDADRLARDLRGRAIVVTEEKQNMYPVVRDGRARVIGADGAKLGEFSVEGHGRYERAHACLVNFVMFYALRHPWRAATPTVRSIFDLLPEH